MLLRAVSVCELAVCRRVGVIWSTETGRVVASACHAELFTQGCLHVHLCWTPHRNIVWLHL